VREIPIELHPRVGESKLSPFRDGWRHLRLILVYSPNFLFTVPGAVMTAIGCLVVLAVLVGVPLLDRELYTHSLIVGCLFVLLGVQAMCFGVCARAYSAYFIGVDDRLVARARAHLRLEHGLLLAGLFVVAGVVLIAIVIGTWAARGFGTLREERLAILALTVLAVGAQLFFTSFLLSIIGLRRTDP
jgi:hypothetical protein